MNDVKFTVVTPIKDEIPRLKKSLPTIYALNPTEVLIITDKPSPPKIVKAVNELSKKYNMEAKTRILEVGRNPEYNYHQAWIRRSGYRNATYDIILTTDVDIYVRKNVLKALNMVGKNGIGMVSLSKFRHPYDLTSLFRAWGNFFLMILHTLIFKYFDGSPSGYKMSTFSGLYALSRPHWLSAENEEELKKMIPPKYKQKISDDINDIPLGEDTFLRDSMLKKKYRVITLDRVGGVVMDREKWIQPEAQFYRGQHYAKVGRSLLGAAVHAIFHTELTFFKGYYFERLRRKQLAKSKT